MFCTFTINLSAAEHLGWSHSLALMSKPAMIMNGKYLCSRT